MRKSGLGLQKSCPVIQFLYICLKKVCEEKWFGTPEILSRDSVFVHLEEEGWRKKCSRRKFCEARFQFSDFESVYQKNKSGLGLQKSCPVIQFLYIWRKKVCEEKWFGTPEILSRDSVFVHLEEEGRRKKWSRRKFSEARFQFSDFESLVQKKKKKNSPRPDQFFSERIATLRK